MSDAIVDKVATIAYTNHRGETAERRIIPSRLYFGSNEWHPEPQWLLDAFDVEKHAMRSFAVSSIHRWVERHYTIADDCRITVGVVGREEGEPAVEGDAR